MKNPRKKESITHKFPLGDRHKVFVVDDVIEKNARPETFHFFGRLSYNFSNLETGNRKQPEQLFHSFKKTEWNTNPIIKSLATYAKSYLEDSDIEPGALKKVYANFNLFGEFQHSQKDRDHWTAIIFVNDKWDDDWGGESYFYDSKKLTSPSTHVFPKPGRMVIFDGELFHREGVPSKFCLVPRVSLTMKFAKRS